MNIAYVRGISKDHNIGRQLEAFKGYTIDRVRIYQEKVLNQASAKSALEEMLQDLREGDKIYIESFQSLARTVSQLLEIIDALTKKNVGFVSIKEKINTTTPAGKLQLGVFAAMYQFHRECSKERKREGIDISEVHRPLGRPKQFSIDDNFIAIYQKWKAGTITAVQAMQLANIKKVTWYKLAKEYEEFLQTKQEI